MGRPSIVDKASAYGAKGGRFKSQSFLFFNSKIVSKSKSKSRRSEAMAKKEEEPAGESGTKHTNEGDGLK